MKPKYLIILFLSIITLSCSENDDNNNDDSQNDPIIGEWQLNRRVRFGFFEETYNPGDVTYRFNTDGTANIISIIPEVDSETIEYEIINDCLVSPGCLNGDTPSNLLIINGTIRNTFSFFSEDTEMIFGEGWRDWWDYYLERLP